MRFFINSYVEKLSISDVKRFGYENGIILTDEEAKILYFYAKNNWEDLLYGKHDPIIQEIEKKFDKSKSKLIVDLFFQYKDKYKNYL